MNYCGFTGGDYLSNKGALLKTYQEIFFWPPKNDTPLYLRLSQDMPFSIPYYAEVQGEAIAWGEKNDFYTISEKNESAEQELIYYTSKQD